MSLLLSILSGNQSLDPGSTPTFAAVLNSSNIGTPGTGVTAVEYGDGYDHVTVLTVSTTLPAIAGGASLGVGKLMYTFPAGVIDVEQAYITMAITQTQGNINANTPNVGLGTTIASGVVSTLSGTAAFENALKGSNAANCTGTATKSLVTCNLELIAADDHTFYFNAAAAWAAGGDSAALLTGTIVIDWKFIA